MSTVVAGPVLFARGSDDALCRVSALVVVVHDDAKSALPIPEVALRAGEFITPIVLAQLCGYAFLTFDLDFPVCGESQYSVDGVWHSVVTDLTDDMRVGYVSCNGVEHGDRDRGGEERNLMWRRLLAEHRERPLALLLHGGDQLYADEANHAHHELQHWAESDDDERSNFAFSSEARMAAQTFFVDRYIALYSQPDVAPLLACVPSLMMWDDHDIFDGWGSHSPGLLDSPIGIGLFSIAREAFLLFQRALPVTSDRTLSHRARFPGLEVLAPDLRSERRMDCVMGPAGWQQLEEDLKTLQGADRVILMSSVPLLGPRLSWIERLIPVVPRLRRYEDDLRDQWQSRSHRSEWRRLLMALDGLSMSGCEITVVSGEIHLASRGEMPIGQGRTLHQLIASGIAHPAPPQAWATALGWLAKLGEDPIPGRRIRLLPLPKGASIYTAERNYLIMERHNDRWTAVWECETTGRTDALTLD